ncbi:predicted protein [Chaetomium globosum CBS 148.51]|uniref:Zn(2)-C6 fungal-type domain-containing protein n=1 Tax=Chaetomium globosum (strain ATCC 6205 / CBS 148.51 / DSM 1962 / NBRC 6347 / NRRL 1970) TaxID=306901 RepID=Q2H3G6_CHAGB|nr:uncharacterized protein CHGG_06799 [Chaetomium globosum CBS 148.51]EAQ90180.1 predicted protein [Chaetomium globosum CBS 148.51]
MTITDQPNSANWQDPSPGAFDFERLLDFGVKDIESRRNKPSRPLACQRCHGQKLRCVRRTSDAPICDRCSSANVECVSRQPQRMGRPAETTTNGLNSAHDAGRPGWRLKAHAESHSRPAGTPLLTATGGTKRRRKSPGDPSASSSPTDMVITYDSAARQFELDGWMWPSGPSLSDAAPPALTAASNTAHSSSGVSSSALVQPSTGFTSYVSPLGSFGSPNALLQSLDDLSNLFPANIEPPCFEPQRTPETSDGVSDDQLSPSDAVEHLSRLHLELYHCLVAVKAVEKMKRDRLRYQPPTKPGGDIDTSWSENLFRTTERFIEALEDYVGPQASDPCFRPSSGPAPTTMDDDQNRWEDTDPSNPGPQVDTATGLMIVSCYTRLVQIFDVVVFVVETFQDMDCPGSYVQVRFGDFTPTVNKRFQARALGQYVLHLLEGISDGVDRAVASRQPYARAVAEVRRNEGRLKERILTTFHGGRKPYLGASRGPTYPFVPKKGRRG